MTVYQYCMEEADVCRACAKKSPTKRMHDHFLADAEMWEARAGRLSVEDGSRDVKDVVLYTLFEVKEAPEEAAAPVKEDDDDGEEGED